MFLSFAAVIEKNYFEKVYLNVLRLLNADYNIISCHLVIRWQFKSKNMYSPPGAVSFYLNLKVYKPYKRVQNEDAEI